MKPQVSVLILNYRNANAAVRCVEQFQQQTMIDQIEIIVIDNHSEDDSIGILRNRLSGYDNVRIIETPKNHGFGYGYNVGAKYASGQYLLINNPDKSMPSDGLEKLIAQMESDTSIGILAPKIRHPDGSLRSSIRRFPRIIDLLSRRSALGKICPRSLRRYLMLDVDMDHTQEVEWVVGGCFFIRTDLFKKLDGFDERFFLFFEDTDLCRRVRESGKCIVYFPEVVVGDKRHRLSGQSFRDLLFSKIGRVHIVSAVKYFGKWGFRQ